MKELLKLINKTEWYRQAGNCKSYYIFIPCRGAADHLNAKHAIWSIKKNIIMEWVSPLVNFIDTSRKALDKQKKDPKYINKYMAECKERSIKLYKFYTKYLNTDISKLNIQQISKALHELEDLNYNYWCFSYLCDAFDPKGDDMLIEEIKKHNINLSKEEIDVFMKTNWKNYMQKERLAMLNIALKVKNKTISHHDTKKAIEQHSKTYFYIDNSWESTTVLTHKDFIERLEEILTLDLNQIKEQLEDLETDWDEKHKELQNKHLIPQELMNIFFFFSQLFKLRDQRKKHTLITNYVYDLFFSRVADIFDLEFDDLSVILAEEITKNITKQDLINKISARKNIVMEYYSGKKTTLFLGDEGLKIYDEIHKTFLHEGDVIKGNSASPGKVKGIVRVIMGEAHFSKFNPGEILVAPMTRPEFLPLMKKAKAIITDEGGITCHAAIVSRELGIPCIIGTKIATKVLKDNDEVEIDANKGIVRKL